MIPEGPWKVFSRVYSTEALIARLRHFGHGQDLFMLAAGALEYSLARADALQEELEWRQVP